MIEVVNFDQVHAFAAIGTAHECEQERGLSGLDGGMPLATIAERATPPNDGPSARMMTVYPCCHKG